MHTINVHLLCSGLLRCSFRVFLVGIVTHVNSMFGFLLRSLSLLSNEVSELIIQIVIHGCGENVLSTSSQFLTPVAFPSRGACYVM